MKILVVAPEPFYEERGTPIATRRLVETLAAHGHEVDLLTYPLGSEVSVANASVHRSARIPGIRSVPIGLSWRKLALDVPLTAALARRAGPEDYDVVHAVEETIFPALFLRPRHRAQVVYDMDSSMSRQLLDQFRALRPAGGVLRAMEAWAIREADLVVAVSDDLSALARMHRAAGSHVHVVRDTPVEAAPTGRPVDDLRADWPERTTTIAMYVGNLAPYQGIDLLLDAAERLRAGDGIGLVVVGGVEGRIAAYRKRVQERGLGDRIRFVGPRPLGDLSSYLAQADILVSPRNRGANTPLKIYSYMASGRAIAATRLPPHTQVLDDDTAVLCEPDGASITGALRRLAGTPELRARLAEAARLRVRERYSASAYDFALRKAYAVLDGTDGP